MGGEQGHILVCVNEHPKNRVLLYAAARLSRETNMPWVVVYVEEPGYYTLSGEHRESILKCLTRAEEMGAEVYQVRGCHVDVAVMGFINEYTAHHNTHFEHIIIGEPKRSGLFPLRHGQNTQKLKRRLSQFGKVHLMELAGEKVTSRIWAYFAGETVEMRHILYSFLAVGLAGVSVEFLRRFMPDYVFLLHPQNIALIFLIAIVYVGGKWGLVPAMVTALVSHLTINFFYVSPYFMFTLTQVSDLVNLLLFLVTAITVALFSSNSRSIANAADKREKRIQALYQLQRITSPVQSHYEALKVLYDNLERQFEMKVAFFRPDAEKGGVLEYPPQMELDERTMEAMRICFRDAITTGVGSAYSKDVQWRFEPLFSGNRVIGVLGAHIPEQMKVDADFGKLLTAVADQCVAVFQRITLTRRMEDAKVSEEKEKLRSLLLSAVSHDLKTPLASIIGSLSVYHSMFEKLSDEHKRTLTLTALDEAQRLDSFISNILDMTRLESGHVKFKCDWHNPAEMVKRVAKRMRNRLREREFRLFEPQAPFEMWVDGVMAEQLFQNLIDNAVKYSPMGGAVEVLVMYAEDGCTIQVRDHGAGIPEEMRTRIFDKYERLQKEDSQVAGTGLGLAICKSIVEQMGGNIRVFNHDEGGAVFEVRFPKVKLLQCDDIAV